MTSDRFVLLPPSQGKTPDGRGRFAARSGRFASLGPQRREVVTALAAAVNTDPASAAKLLGARGELLDRALSDLERLSAGRAPVLPAVERYSGVVWEHLHPSDLPVEQAESILVPSAVLGWSAGTDPVPDHRLTFATSVPGLGRLDRWWRPHLTAALAEATAGGEVWDLLPHEHAAAVDLDEVAVAARVIRVRFTSADGRRAAGHGAKAAKGRVARSILRGGLRSVVRFRWEGWQAVRTGDDEVEVRAPG